jgi:hypothetical protein
MRRINFHTFTMGDVDDVEIYVAQPIWEWQQTEHGQWVMAHCKDPQYRIGADDNKWGHRVVLYGDLEDKDAMFHQLKWGHV